MLKLKVTNNRGEKIGILRSLARYVMAFLPGIPMLYYCLPFMDPAIVSQMQNYRPEIQRDSILESHLVKFFIWSVVAVIGGTIWYITVAFTKQKTAIHDLLSKTRVIKSKRISRT